MGKPLAWLHSHWSIQFTSDFGIAYYVRNPCMNEIKGDSVIAARSKGPSGASRKRSRLIKKSTE